MKALHFRVSKKMTEELCGDHGFQSVSKEIHVSSCVDAHKKELRINFVVVRELGSQWWDPGHSPPTNVAYNLGQNKMEQQTPIPPKSRMKPREGQKHAIFPSLIWGGGGAKVFHLFCPRLWVQIPSSLYVGWVCDWLSPSLLQEAFLWILRFSLLLKS